MNDFKFNGLPKTLNDFNFNGLPKTFAGQPLSSGLGGSFTGGVNLANGGAVHFHGPESTTITGAYIKGGPTVVPTGSSKCNHFLKLPERSTTDQPTLFKKMIAKTKIEKK